jgi:hypothetical protein
VSSNTISPSCKPRHIENDGHISCPYHSCARAHVLNGEASCRARLGPSHGRAPSKPTRRRRIQQIRGHRGGCAAARAGLPWSSAGPGRTSPKCRPRGRAGRAGLQRRPHLSSRTRATTPARRPQSAADQSGERRATTPARRPQSAADQSGERRAAVVGSRFRGGVVSGRKCRRRSGHPDHRHRLSVARGYADGVGDGFGAGQADEQEAAVLGGTGRRRAGPAERAARQAGPALGRSRAGRAPRPGARPPLRTAPPTEDRAPRRACTPASGRGPH